MPHNASAQAPGGPSAQAGGCRLEVGVGGSSFAGGPSWVAQQVSGGEFRGACASLVIVFILNTNEGTGTGELVSGAPHQTDDADGTFSPSLPLSLLYGRVILDHRIWC